MLNQVVNNRRARPLLLCDGTQVCTQPAVALTGFCGGYPQDNIPPEGLFFRVACGVINAVGDYINTTTTHKLKQ